MEKINNSTCLLPKIKTTDPAHNNSATNLILIKQQKIFKMRSKNIDKQLKLAKINFAIKQTDFFKKMVSKKGEENNDQFLEKMLKVQEKCTEHVFAGA